MGDDVYAWRCQHGHLLAAPVDARQPKCDFHGPHTPACTGSGIKPLWPLRSGANDD